MNSGSGKTLESGGVLWKLDRSREKIDLDTMKVLDLEEAHSIVQKKAEVMPVVTLEYLAKASL